MTRHTHGGRRKNQTGRPRHTEQKTEQVKARFTPDEIAHIEAARQPNESRAACVRRLVMEIIKNKEQEMTQATVQQAAVRISTFYTDPGYVDSTDDRLVRLLTPEQVVSAMGDAETLHDIAMNEGQAVRPEDLIDVVKTKQKHHAGEYEIYEGVLHVPSGLIAVEVIRTAWCTSDHRTYEGRVIDGKEALKEMYLRRSREYAKLAAQIDE
jgi:hypothetical protein